MPGSRSQLKSTADGVYPASIACTSTLRAIHTSPCPRSGTVSNPSIEYPYD